MSANNSIKNNKVSILGLTQIFSFIVLVLSIGTVFNDFHRLLELFSHFKLQYFIASIIFSLIFFGLRLFKSGCILALTAMLNLFYILPWYLDQTPEESSKELNTLKLLQSNVQTSNTNYQALIDLVIEQSPDILIAQEVSQAWIEALNKIETILPYKQIRAREDNFGIAIFSRVPFDESEVIYLGTSNLPSIKISFTINQQKITLITTHPLPPINKLYYEQRNAQLKSLSMTAKEIKNPLILIGDFNVTMWSKDYLELEEFTNLTNSRKGFGLLPTWPTNILPFMIPIDHCLVSSEFKVLDMVVGKDIGSDHLPLIVTLGLINNINPPSN